ncbi:MAG: AAA family ATPase [Oscillospiraceae bacterium]|nr:AAA family ATPase [Oscillospiraceae bacterium]
MYLRALEIQGFKSFPDKTRLTFEKDITAIVGPNGSGKSNISDAILWVMGEQRTKALRGTKMEDVIFGGTEKRGKLGYAQVSLIIDNSAHIFDSDSSEIMLTRRYYRSGESEYFINRESVRLKDINSLLMDTGLGRDGYSIIGQGRIAEIVSTKSTDRREVFEEAAGISRYRYRKEEAERKLERTEDNLLRINDKIEELEMQVGPLKEQSEIARRYLVLRDELKGREVSVWMATLEKLHAQAESVNLEYEQVTKDLENARASLEALYASSGSITERMHQKDVETERARERLSAEEGAAAECESASAVIRANIESTRESAARLLEDMQRQESRAQELRAQIGENERRVAAIDAELSAAEESEKQTANIIDGCRLKIQSREAILNDLTERANRLSVELKSTESRIAMLEEMEKNFEGYSGAVRSVMREAEHGALRGIHGPAANLVKTDRECALAIETALGASAQHIVVDTQNDGKNAIEFLKRRDAGRATFLPMDTIRGSVMRDAPVNDPGFVGVAFDLVSFDEQYRGIFENLLGRTVVAETLTDAVRMAKATSNRVRIVTLDGQVINAGGSMTGGSSAKNSGILSRANELETLRSRRASAEEKARGSAAELERARANLANVRYQLDSALADQAEQRSARSSREAERRTTENAVSQLSALLGALTGDSEQRKLAAAESEKQIASLQQQLADKEKTLAAITGRIAAIRDEIAQITSGRLELEGKRTRAEKETQERNAEIIALERQSAKIEQKKLSADMEEKQILDRLWDNYELSFTEASALRKPIESMAKENRLIADLRREISSLGTPNLGAIEEYKRVSERYEFLSTQRDDVEKAKGELLGIIRDITGEMEEVFITQFRAIDEAFRTTFRELFGGGKASLELEDENDVLSCGIEIKVQPPGKAITTISLLSGGEMAFVAIALYFAILKVRPTPFCVMDEIEAALDEANVNRYADYMRRMADRTQFLVITHRRGTMEAADMLYGVTMQEKGVSSVIELDLESAQKTIEED